MKKIPPGAEASNVLVGELEFLERPVVAFVRLAPAVLLNGLAEVPITTRLYTHCLSPYSVCRYIRADNSLNASLEKDLSENCCPLCCTGFFSSCSAPWEKARSIMKSAGLLLP